MDRKMSWSKNEDYYRWVNRTINYTEFMEGEYGYMTLYTHDFDPKADIEALKQSIDQRTGVSLWSLIDAHYPFWANKSKDIVIEEPIIKWYYEHGFKGDKRIYWSPEK